MKSEKFQKYFENRLKTNQNKTNMYDKQ